MIGPDDPAKPDVRALLERHLAFAHATTRPEDVHALDVEALRTPQITFVSFRDAEDRVLGVAALKDLGGGHGELKSMHTAQEARGKGIARQLLEHLIGLARDRGFTRLSLETGSQEAFAPARRLYLGAGFEPCEAFDTYVPSRNSTYLTLSLEG